MTEEVQDKIVELELRVKGILGSIPAGIVFITAEGIIEANTPRFENMLGYETRDIVGKGISRFINTTMTDRELARRFAEASADGLLRAEAVKCDGVILSVLITADMIDTVEGVGLMLCILDATKESAL